MDFKSQEASLDVKSNETAFDYKKFDSSVSKAALM
jgi:hypothetical protein